MNERIRELYITAMREDCGEKWDTQEEFIARFAELIVRECTAVSRKSSKRIDDMGSLIAQDIKKHFG